jgi:hypothetical protein
MSDADIELYRLFDSAAGRRLSDVRNVLVALIASAPPHNRVLVERLATDIYDAALWCLLPDGPGDARRDTP